MAMRSEKVVVTAREFILEKNINDCKDLNEPVFQSKLQELDWDMSFAAAAIFCELVWKISVGRNNLRDWRELDRLFSSSPVGTHANFRGCRKYKTGNVPELGALAVWRRGNSWQGHMGVVSGVAASKEEFSIIEARVLSGSDGGFLKVEEKSGKRVGLPFKTDKLNLLGFIYPQDVEIRYESV